MFAGYNYLTSDYFPWIVIGNGNHIKLEKEKMEKSYDSKELRAIIEMICIMQKNCPMIYDSMLERLIEILNEIDERESE